MIERWKGSLGEAALTVCKSWWRADKTSCTYHAEGDREHGSHFHVSLSIDGGEDPPFAPQLTANQLPELDMIYPDGDKVRVRVRSELSREDALRVSRGRRYQSTWEMNHMVVKQYNANNIKYMNVREDNSRS